MIDTLLFGAYTVDKYKARLLRIQHEIKPVIYAARKGAKSRLPSSNALRARNNAATCAMSCRV